MILEGRNPSVSFSITAHTTVTRQARPTHNIILLAQVWLPIASPHYELELDSFSTPSKDDSTPQLDYQLPCSVAIGICSARRNSSSPSGAPLVLSSTSFYYFSPSSILSPSTEAGSLVYQPFKHGQLLSVRAPAPSSLHSYLSLSSWSVYCRLPYGAIIFIISSPV